MSEEEIETEVIVQEQLQIDETPQVEAELIELEANGEILETESTTEEIKEEAKDLFDL